MNNLNIALKYFKISNDKYNKMSKSDLKIFFRDNIEISEQFLSFAKVLLDNKKKKIRFQDEIINDDNIILFNQNLFTNCSSLLNADRLFDKSFTNII
jgi:hypothetical protein